MTCDRCGLYPRGELITLSRESAERYGCGRVCGTCIYWLKPTDEVLADLLITNEE